MLHECTHTFNHPAQATISKKQRLRIIKSCRFSGLFLEFIEWIQINRFFLKIQNHIFHGKLHRKISFRRAFSVLCQTGFKQSNQAHDFPTIYFLKIYAGKLLEYMMFILIHKSCARCSLQINIRPKNSRHTIKYICIVCQSLGNVFEFQEENYITLQ